VHELVHSLPHFIRNAGRLPNQCEYLMAGRGFRKVHVRIEAARFDLSYRFGWQKIVEILGQCVGVDIVARDGRCGNSASPRDLADPGNQFLRGGCFRQLLADLLGRRRL
jgi:hypothetical protein